MWLAPIHLHGDATSKLKDWERKTLKFQLLKNISSPSKASCITRSHLVQVFLFRFLRASIIRMLTITDDLKVTWLRRGTLQAGALDTTLCLQVKEAFWWKKKKILRNTDFCQPNIKRHFTWINRELAASKLHSGRSRVSLCHALHGF